MAICAYEKEISESNDSYSERAFLVRKYSWAIPNNEAISTLVKMSPLIEIGAGKGYWASLISKAGGDIIAFDIKNKNNKYTDNQLSYFDIKYGNSTTVKKYPDRNLFLCWPPYLSTCALNTLKNFKGKFVIYVGEFFGCTACDKFHQLLQKNFIEINRINIPQFWGIHDFVYIFERK